MMILTDKERENKKMTLQYQREISICYKSINKIQCYKTERIVIIDGNGKLTNKSITNVETMKNLIKIKKQK